MAKNLLSDPILVPLTQIWAPKFFFSWILLLPEGRNCCKLSLYVNSRKTIEPNLRKWQKSQFRTRFWVIWPNFRPPKYFFKNLAWSITRYHGQLSSCAISEKTNDTILKKLSVRRTDGLTDGLTDRQTDGSDFIGPCRLT